LKLRLSGHVDVKTIKGMTENLLNDGIDVRISTRGPSMFPLISTGDKITIHFEKDYEMGELIVFKRDGQMVCHRLVNIFEQDGKRYYQTRGDSFFGLDEPVTSGQILGKVIKIERENVSLPRRILLFIFPALRFGRLNAFVISALIKIRRLIPSAKSA
jgi:signal peptidase I